jgi:hypothetical protein
MKVTAAITAEIARLSTIHPQVFAPSTTAFAITVAGIEAATETVAEISVAIEVAIATKTRTRTRIKIPEPAIVAVIVAVIEIAIRIG